MTSATINAGLASTARLDLGGKTTIAGARSDAGISNDRAARADIGDGMARAPARKGAQRNAGDTSTANTSGATAAPSARTDHARAQADVRSTAAAAPSFARMLGVAVQDASGEQDSTTDTAPDTVKAEAGDGLPAAQQPGMAALLLQPAALAGSTPQTAAPQRDTAGMQAVAALNPAASRLDLSAAGVAVLGGTGLATGNDSNSLARQAALLAESGATGTGDNPAARLAATLATAAPATASAALAASSAMAAPTGAGDKSTTSATAEQPAGAGRAAAPAAMPIGAVATAIANPVTAPPDAGSARFGASFAQASGAGSGTAGDAAPAAATVTVSTAKDDARSAAPAAGTPVTGFGAVAAGPATPAAAAVVKLAGAPEQWQQPLRDALGDRLQLNLQRNNDHAVIRLDPPNMGSVEISIRHSAGSLQVNLSASNSEVLRQLNTIGDSVRQDLSQRQFSEVAVTVSAARAQPQSQGQAQAQSDGGRQQREQEQRTPGRALDDDAATSTFAMYEQE